MDRNQYRKRALSMLKGIVKQRAWLIAHDKSYIDSAWCRQEISNIEYALPKLVDPAQVKSHIERKQTALRLLIPGTNKRRHDELRELIEETLN